MEGTRYSFVFLCLTTMAAALGQKSTGPPHNKTVVCYVATWAVYRPGAGSFDLGSLDPRQCTHLVYSFAGLDETNWVLKSLDPWQDLEKDYGKNGYKRLTALKETHPHLSVTLAVGGWNEGSLKYSMMAAEPERRGKFIKSVLMFMETYGFDGLDLDWEYPARRDGRPQDKANYVSLVKELNEAFQPHGYILTAALGAGRDTMEAAYELSKLSRYLDYLHLMCYDYHGTWDGVAGANAPLRAADKDPLSVEFTINYMLEHGVSPYKMVLGLPLYGRSFVLTEPGSPDVVFGKTRVQSQGFQGPYTREAGFLGYNEICAERANSSAGWRRHWDDLSQTPYLRDGARLIAYDDGRSLASKVKMAIDYDLGGVMVWSIDTDDFRADCSPEEGALQDFEQRAEDMANDPVLSAIMDKLNLPDVSSKQHRKRSIYVTDNGRLSLRAAEAEVRPFPLMRSVNDAVALAIDEKRIVDEIARAVKDNEVDDTQQPKQNGGNRIAKCQTIVVVVSFLLSMVSVF